MNLWTAEKTVKAIIMELAPAKAQELDPERLESVVEEQAIQMLEEIQEIEDLNKGTSLDREEISEVASTVVNPVLADWILTVHEAVSDPPV